MFVPDLLFGSKVVGGLQSAGFSPALVSDLDSLRGQLSSTEVLIVDLTSDATERIEQVRELCPSGVRTLGFYSHVENDVRERAERAGFDLVVPRSRMAREGTALVRRVLSGT